MKWGLFHNYYYPTYFYTKREALDWLATRTDAAEYTLKKKIGGNWFDAK